MKKTGERGPMYGTELIDALPLGTGGFCQAMPDRKDLQLVRKHSERAAAAYEVLLRHFHEVVEERDSLKQRLGCVVRNCQHIDDTQPRDEPGPMCGPTWGKVAHICGLGSSSAVDLCYQYDVDPHFDCSKVEH